MGVDEDRTLYAPSERRRDLTDASIASLRCGIVKTTGDGILVEFASAVDAACCAVLLYSICVHYTFRGKDRKGYGRDRTASTEQCWVGKLGARAELGGALA
jgi:hypothetical protein